MFVGSCMGVRWISLEGERGSNAAAVPRTGVRWTPLLGERGSWIAAVGDGLLVGVSSSLLVTVPIASLVLAESRASYAV